MDCVWDDGSYDASDDADNNQAACSAQGGTYMSGVTGDYSGAPDDELAFQASEIQAAFVAATVNATVSGPQVLFVTMTSDTTGDFVSTLPELQTISYLKQEGFVEHAFDYLNFNHMGQLDLRDSRSQCSIHVTVDKEPDMLYATGGFHTDSFNPAYDFLDHTIDDEFRVAPGSETCPR